MLLKGKIDISNQNGIIENSHPPNAKSKALFIKFNSCFSFGYYYYHLPSYTA